jgi:hypothetical protein
MVAVATGHSADIALVQPSPCLLLKELAIQAPLHSGLLLPDGGAHVLCWRHRGAGMAAGTAWGMGGDASCSLVIDCGTCNRIKALESYNLN